MTSHISIIGLVEVILRIAGSLVTGAGHDMMDCGKTRGWLVLEIMGHEETKGQKGTATL